MIISFDGKSQVILLSYCITTMMSIDYLSKLTAIVCIGMIITIDGCKSSRSQPTSEVTQQSLDALASEKYGAKAKIFFNKSKSHALVYREKVTTNDPLASIHFFVFDQENAKIILEDFVQRGTVEWSSESIIKVTKIPGVYNADNPTKGYSFDINTQKKIPIKI